jgi:RNA polymerase sigma-70 factor (ECF subfamily)
VALTLRLVTGLDTAEIARAFLLSEATLAQRLVRAKRKLRENHAAYRVPPPAELPDRLHAVLAVVYLVFNAGHTASAGDSLARVDLCAEGIRLGRVLATLMPDEPEVSGLVALMLLTDARRAARTSADGSFVALADQDRSRWDRTMIAEGHEIVRACIRRDRPGRYQLMAAIAAVHDAAATFEATDWAQILTVYDHLYSLRPDPVVRLNRAVAVAELHGPVVGLDELDELAGVLDGYQPFHATRAELLLRLGDPAAAAAFDRAIALTTNEVERRHLERRRAAC